MWASICATAPVAYHSETAYADTTEYSSLIKNLDEIIVRSSPIINKTDRKIIRPDKETQLTAADGIDHMAAQYNKGQSVWSISAGYMV
ncbi:MAG: hypothetical protein K2N76_05460 [Muribaculaceae bacterium]|nr:hypothetical protein [Muribaculaceae bacterium]